ncbi:NmrA family NAD(P)-binding protein [Gordonia humi]|uniref:Uncharacterized protein YbjT (DUF2867 family) n=1 Tax=Gordonia humi TaxID=686429 RepID=A0A840FEW0_9ACTN|nr:NmrA family NAD(P)-binding protein [Gordonia humi]MBB4137987.1 uncharacterized protein YbjT (DUF2867 family) [Gordonia humi]
MIVVTGATGILNGATVEHLLKRVPAETIGVSARDTMRAQHFADRGVRVRTGSYDDPITLRRSFDGAEQVLLVSSSDHTADVLAQHRNAIEAAVAAGAQRILYTSLHGADFEGTYPALGMHAATEAMLAESGVAWTSLRNGFFGDLNMLLGPWQDTGVISMPADGPIPWVDRADAGEAAAAVLAADRRFDGPVSIAPSETVSLADFAVAASELTGRTIERVVVDDEQWVGDQVTSGVPESVARFTLSMFQATRTGYFADGGALLTELLGRQPRSAAEQLADTLIEPPT